MEKSNKEKFLYLKLIGILFIPLCLIFLYSYWDKEIKIKNITLQKADFSHLFFPSFDILKEIPADSIESEQIEIKDSIVIDTTSQRILLFGDSMVEGISKRMRNYVAENDHELLSVIWYSSSTKIWAESDTLAHFIKNFSPTYVMLCLGGNELFVRDLDKREAYIKTILEKIDTLPYIWIGPPNWKEDTGINDLIERNTNSKRYFPSKNLTYERGSDGAHPTMASAASWTDSIVCWMNEHAQHRIRMDFPENNKQQKGKTTLLMPLK